MSLEFRRALTHAAAGRVGALATAAVAHVLAVRALGAAGYGSYVLAESVVFTLGIVALCGTHLAAFSLRDAAPRALLAGGSLLIGGLALLATTALLVLQAVLDTPYSSPQWALLGGAAVLGLALYRFTSELVRIVRGAEVANYFTGRAAGFVSSAWFLVALVARLRTSTLTPFDLLATYATAQWLGVGTALALLAPALRARAPAPQSASAIAAELWRRGGRITSSQLLQTTLVNVDVWTLGALGTPALVGVYGLAKRFATWLLAPAGLVAMSAIKRAVDEYFSAGRVSAELEAAFRNAVVHALLLIAAVVALIALLPPAWLEAVAGPTAPLSRPLFVALGVGQLVRLAFGNGGNILTAAGHEADNFNAYLRGNGIAIGVALVAVPLFGSWGAAASFSAGTIAAAMLVSRACRTRMNFNCDFVRV